MDWAAQQRKAMQDQQNMSEALSLFGQATAPGQQPGKRPGQPQQPGQPGGLNINLAMGQQPGAPGAGTALGDLGSRYGINPQTPPGGMAAPMSQPMGPPPGSGMGPAAPAAFAQGGAVEGEDSLLSPLEKYRMFLARRGARSGYAHGGHVSLAVRRAR